MSALFSTEIKKILDLFREKSKNDSSEKIESRKMYIWISLIRENKFPRNAQKNYQQKLIH